jgi:hypothetical protein
MADEDFTKDNVSNGAFAEAGATTEDNGTESEATKETADQGNIIVKVILFPTKHEIRYITVFIYLLSIASWNPKLVKLINLSQLYYCFIARSIYYLT